MLFVFLGPEMTQSERDEEATVVLEYEHMRAQGVSLQEIGAGRVKIAKHDGEIVAQHVEDVNDSDDNVTPVATRTDNYHAEKV